MYMYHQYMIIYNYLQGRCGDGNKVTHSHNYKYATFNRESAMKVNSALKETRELLQDVRRGRERERERESSFNFHCTSMDMLVFALDGTTICKFDALFCPGTLYACLLQPAFQDPRGALSLSAHAVIPRTQRNDRGCSAH